MNYSNIINQNKVKWLELAPDINEDSGIYVLRRTDENGIRYAYVGQAKHLLTRLAEHLSGFQWIDLSLKKHGLYNAFNNPYGYLVWTKNYKISDLDEMERYWIKQVANAGFQLRNATLGGQDKGKYGIDGASKPPKGYQDGVKQGYLNARREIAKLFKSSLIVEINGNDGVRKQNALAKFNEFIKVDTDDEQ